MEKKRITALKNKKTIFEKHRVKSCEQFFKSRQRTVVLDCVCELGVLCWCRGVAQPYSYRDRFPEGMICLFVLATCPRGKVRMAFPGGVLVFGISQWIVGFFETWFKYRLVDLKDIVKYPGDI